MQLRCAREPSLMFTRSRKIENTLKQLPKIGIRAARLIFCRKSILPRLKRRRCHSLRTSLFEREFLQKASIYWFPEKISIQNKAHCRTLAEKGRECVVEGMSVCFTVSSL